jgi:NADPH:quinone reductase-like Zn-dependent oxidoreductase
MCPASSTTLPSTMRAVRCHEFGGPDVLQLDEVPVPHPGLRDTNMCIARQLPGLSIRASRGATRREQLALQLLGRGQISMPVAAVVPLADVRRGHELQAESAHVGKIVLSMEDSQPSARANAE